jgi:hypothetical protein
MKPSVLYRAAAVLLLLFAVGHTLGFTQSDPKWGVDGVLAAMRSQRFDIGGFERSWWDFYLAAGLTAALFYVFAAILAWQLGSLQAEALAQLRATAWAFALAFAGVTAVSWIYLFLIPIAFSTLITLCLIAAAWLSSR